MGAGCCATLPSAMGGAACWACYSVRPVNNWNRIPEALRQRPQWAVAGASKAPMALINGKLRNVSVVAPSEWMSFDDAAMLAWERRDMVTTWTNPQGVEITQIGLTIGYILNASDPFSCIDLDVKDAVTHPNEPDKWTTPDQFQFYQDIIAAFDSYTEKSKSGKGFHTWIRGKIGKGYRRDGVEVYSQERFIISTGDVVLSKTVENREHMLLNMVTRMRPMQKVVELEELEQEADDWYILHTAVNASNSDKFIKLWKGMWREDEFAYGSQSEADLALMSMFTFYSPSNAQVRRLFRESGLGKREKAQKDDKYINLTLKTIRDRQEREQGVEMNAILAAADSMIEQQRLAREAIQDAQGGVPAATAVTGPFGTIAPRTISPLQVPGTGEPVATQAPPEAQLAQAAPVTPAAIQAVESGLQWPPGFVGTLAQYIFNSSYLPIKEVSITAALGLMAGMCGKAWHIPGSGLNLYIVLVARSAIGKEALHSGIANVVSACLMQSPIFGNYVDFTEYASGPALIKACAGNSSFVNVSGEWGRRMKRIAGEDDREGPMTTLRTQMTNLYQKSAPRAIVGGIGYSSTDNNIEALTSVAYSMVGESTPQTFFDSLTESMMEDGFLSRFLVIQYEGDRPDENHNILERPDDAMVKYLCAIANVADEANRLGESQGVLRTEEAARRLQEFSLLSSKNIRSTTDESKRQMWNRATLKVLRIAALLAVADNMRNPIITIKHAEWAINLIEADIAIMRKRMEGGDVGLNDASRERKLVEIMRSYTTQPVPGSYKIPEAMRANGIIPRNYLQLRVSRVSSFYKHKFGTSKALDESMAQMIANGIVMEVKGDKLVEAYSHHGKAYRILKLPDYATLGDDA